MKKLIYIFILFAYTAQAQLHKTVADTEFFYTYGGTNFDEARDIKETLDKNYILAGTTSSFGQGNTSVYIIKTDALGNHIWSTVQGGAENDWAYAVELTADSGFFVAGYSNSFNASGHNYSSPYYLKTDKNGVLVWQKSIDVGSWSFIYGSCALQDSGYVLCGQTYYSTPNGSSDAYLMRINKNGDTLWTHHYGGIQDEIFNSVCLINNKLYAVGSNASNPSDTMSDGWVVKLDMNGSQLQEAFLSYGPHQQESINGITPYNNTLFSVCGNQTHTDSSNAITAIVVRYDTSLIITLDVTTMNSFYNLTNNPTTMFNKIVNISYDDICIIGSKLAGLGGLGMFLVGINSSGFNYNSFFPSVGGHYNDYGYSGIYTSSGRVIGVGSTLSTQDFCTNNNLGIEDVFLVRLNSDSINNFSITHTNYQCFADTLFLWQANIKNYDNNINLKLFPNPTYNNVTLHIRSSNTEEYEAKVFSMLGEEVISLKVNSNNDISFSVTNIASGTYFLKLFDRYKNFITTLKFSVIN